MGISNHVLPPPLADMSTRLRPGHDPLEQLRRDLLRGRQLPSVGRESGRAAEFVPVDSS